MEEMRAGFVQRNVLSIGICAVATGAALTAAPAVAASDVIDGCGQSCEIDCPDPPGDCREATSGKCKLTADVTCTSSDSPIMLVSGTDLQMAGYEITCTDGTSCNYYAIEMDDPGSKVTSDGSGDTADPEALISGPFVGGVDCQAKNNSIVENLMIADGLFGITSCKTVRNNVILPTDQSAFGVNYGINTGGITNTDQIVENYIQGRVVAILTNGTEDIAILRNVIHTGDGLIAISPAFGQTEANGDIKCNVFLGEGYDGTADVFLVNATTDDVTYAGNVCNEDHPDCATCQADGRCISFTSPFDGNCG